jgi:glycerate 2-kinase
LADSRQLSNQRLLVDLYSAATAAVAPGPALQSRLARLPLDPAIPVWIIALGKAAIPMANAALETLEAAGVRLGGGIVIGAGSAELVGQLRSLRGDHPEPGVSSLAAAEALGEVVAEIPEHAQVWVLLSGGTTSLIGAPEPGLTPEELTALYALLLGSGLDITAMNRIRKRFSRWGGGKLARALAPARTRVFIVSDVVGDDLSSIGSGPCVPDPTSASEVRTLLEDSNLWSRIPESARRLLRSVESGRLPETAKPDDPIFQRVTSEIIASNRHALEAAARRAEELGLEALLFDQLIQGEAAITGRGLARRLLEHCTSDVSADRSKSICLIWGGETTVTFGDQPPGLGGRCQELALAAAAVLRDSSNPVAFLAAGTDGRDGPTDAAGAVVHNHTWPAIAQAGRDPTRDLTSHNAYYALDSVGALLRTGLTGTNVMDVMLGICGKGELRM